MSRGGARAGGLLLALLAAAALQLPYQRHPLALALPALALFVLALADAAWGTLAALALVPVVPVLGNLVAGPVVAPGELVLLVTAAGVLLAARPGGRAESPLFTSLALAAAAAGVAALAALLAAVPVWAFPGALVAFATGFFAVGPAEAAAPLRAALVHAAPLAAYVAVRRLPARLRPRALALAIGSVAAAGAWAVVEAAGGPRLWPPGAYDRFTHFGRVVSSLPDHNAAATLFVTFLFPACALALSERGARRAAALVAALLIGAGLLLTGSRTAWLFGAAAALAVAARGVRLKTALRAAVATAAAAALFFAAALVLPGRTGEVVRERLASLAHPGSALVAVRYGRLPFWETGGSMIAAHPFAGVGPGRVPARFAEHRPAELPVERENLHSWPLQCLAEAGVPGGLLLLLPFGALVPLLARGARNATGAAAGLVPGLAAGAAAGLAAHPWLVVEVSALFWAGAALLEGEAGAAERPGRVALPGTLLLAAWGIPMLAASPGRDFGRFGWGTWGWAEGEGRYEWVSRAAGVWIEPHAGPVVLAVRRPSPEPATEGVTVKARAGFGAWRAVRPEGTGWTPLPLVPPRGDRELLVELRADRAFCPARTGGGDRRVLAVQVRRP